MNTTSNTDLKTVDLFLENDQGAEFWHQKWQKQAFILHISKSSSNEHVKQDMNPREILAKYWKNLILTNLEAQNGPESWAPGAFFLQTYKSSSD